MFRDLLAKFVEPTYDQFDAYFYDINRSCKDFSILPEFLQELIPVPEMDSGTNKFLWIIYQFACRAKNALECGVYTGGTTVPLAMGLKMNQGALVAVDRKGSNPLLMERVNRYNLNNITFIEDNDLNFTLNKDQELFDIIYIDTAHTYEHTVKELFLFDKYMKKGGVYIMHDIIATAGVGLIDSTEDYGYHNAKECQRILIENKGTKHISEYPRLLPTENCHLSPVFLAIQTFLSYRKSYKFFKIDDWAGLGIIWKH